MNDIPLDWFVRENVKEQLFDVAPLIARLVLRLDVDYLNDISRLAQCVDALLPVDNLTAEETEYCFCFVQDICSFESMVDKGLIRRTLDGYELTEVGKACQRELLRQNSV